MWVTDVNHKMLSTSKITYPEMLEHRPLGRRQPGRSVLGGWSYAPQDAGEITETRGLWEGERSRKELAYGFELKCAG
jgi:hypothetical protein